MDAKRTGAFIAQLRTEKGWKQKELATFLQVSDKAISRWETGKGFPETSLLIPLSNALGISVSELLAGERMEAEEKSKKVDELIVETLYDKRNVAIKAIAFFFLILGVAFLASREFVSGDKTLWILGVVMLSISAILFLHKNPSAPWRHGFILFLQAQALFWEFLPLGTVLVFKSGPDLPSTTQTYSYFSLIPFGYANFTPLITGFLTVLCLFLSIFALIRCKITRIIKNAALFCSVFTILFSILPRFLYGSLSMNGASHAVTILLSASALLQISDSFSPHQ